jgi:hypothetical protein
MTYRCVKKYFYIQPNEDLSERLRCLYDSTGHRYVEIDESDLVIFRLMGAQFNYAGIEFEEISPVSELAGSDAS